MKDVWEFIKNYLLYKIVMTVTVFIVMWLIGLIIRLF